MSEPDDIPDTWPDRVRATIARLRAKVAKEPTELYWRLCLQGWEQELARLESNHERTNLLL